VKTRGTIRHSWRPRPRLWAGARPYGLGRIKPNAYREIVRTVWENRRNLPYAWRILTRGVCDGCALGVAGLHDWTISGVHLCSTRLNLLQVNTMGALDPAVMADVATLRTKSGAELRALGRLAHPMVRHAGEPGFRRVTWDEALDLVAGRIRAAPPQRIAFYLTARGITNEVYYVAQKVARFLGTPNIDNAARVCHAPSTAALRNAVGAAATTISYTDLFDTDLVVLFGSHAANAQPVLMKYLYLARKRGVRVVVVNPLREPGLERYWVPSNAESALFGTKMTDLFVPVHTGGDVALVTGVLKLLAERGHVDQAFIDSHTTGWPELCAVLNTHSLDDLVAMSGTPREVMEQFASEYARAGRAVLIWSMGITQHRTGTDNVRALVNLGLSRGNVGRAGAGLMPIRGHSGVQGGAEMGAYATALPGGLAVTPDNAAHLSAQYGFPVPDAPGMSAEEMLEAAGRDELDVLYSSGGNFLDVLPDPDLVRRRLEKVPLRVHQDIVVSSQMLVDAAETVVLLPAATRYEQRGGGTETTTERRIAFSPEIPGPRPGEVRSEWEILVDLAHRVHPDRANQIDFPSAQAVRDEIARVVPFYGGIETLAETGDQVQWGGERLCDGWNFPTADGRAHFSVVEPEDPRPPEGRFILSSRRGKQFNSMVVGEKDPLTGTARDALFLSADDAGVLRLVDGSPVLVRSDTGSVSARVHIAAMRPGNVQMFFPECNPLIRAGVRDGASGVPDYTAVVEVLPAG
jgi:molybdopterin-dependent oxidoreductase alpha subunit